MTHHDSYRLNRTQQNLTLLNICRKLQGEDHSRLSKAARTAAFVQSLVTSLPLVLVSLVTLLRSSIGDEMVDMTDLHRHLNDHSLQGLAASVSLLNLLVTTLRFNERHMGRAVTLLVGFPFLFTNIAFRLLGFSLLFCYFDTVRINIAQHSSTYSTFLKFNFN